MKLHTGQPWHPSDEHPLGPLDTVELGDLANAAQAARRINGLGDLDGIEFLARIDVGTDASGDDKNEIRSAVTPDHRDYAQHMGLAAQPGYHLPAQPAPQQPVQAQPASPVPGRPSWAQ